MQWKEADFVSLDAHAGQLPTGIDDDMELMFRVLGSGIIAVCLKLVLLGNDAVKAISREIK